MPLHFSKPQRHHAALNAHLLLVQGLHRSLIDLNGTAVFNALDHVGQHRPRHHLTAPGQRWKWAVRRMLAHKPLAVLVRLNFLAPIFALGFSLRARTRLTRLPGPSAQTLIVPPRMRVADTAGLADDRACLAPLRMHGAQHRGARRTAGWCQQQSAQAPQGRGAHHQRLPSQAHQIRL